MDPSTFCQEAIARLRIPSTTDDRTRVTDPQAVAVLSYFVKRRLSAEAFVYELTALQRSSFRAGRTNLARAAGRLLEAWQAYPETDQAAG
jgi:hypothetical protein